MRRLSSILWLLIILTQLASPIVINVPMGEEKCFYSDMDSQNILELSFQLRNVEEVCQVQLQVMQQLEDSEVEFNQTRLTTVFECHNPSRNTQFQPYLQKLTSGHEGIAKLRTCVKNIMSHVAIPVEIKVNVRMNPIYYVHDEEQMSFVMSTDMRYLHDVIHNATNKLVAVEGALSDFEATERELMQKNAELQGQLRRVDNIQMAILSVIGLIWILVLRTLN